MHESNFINGKFTRTSSFYIVLNQDNAIKELDPEGTYNYLRMNEGDGIKHLKKYYRSIRMVLKSELNAINEIEAINTVTTPVVTYSYKYNKLDS